MATLLLNLATKSLNLATQSLNLVTLLTGVPRDGVHGFVGGNLPGERSGKFVENERQIRIRSARPTKPRSETRGKN